ncbi:MAG: hypothetical protein IPK26_06800 [Planctomycetes bacterium]|nr:hypothetical protein [Planctomycetota bacterium]
MRSFAPSLLSLGLLPVAFAQEFQSAAQPGVIPGQQPAAEATSLALSRMVGGTWVTEWNAATQTPRSIIGTGIALADWRENTLEEARRHALASLTRFHDLLGLGTSEFREIIGSRMGRSWTFTFDQFFNGLEVIGGRADVRINMRGVIAMLGSCAWQIPVDFRTVPQIGEEVAVASAWAALAETPTGVKQPGIQRKPRLVIWGDEHATEATPVFLAWEVPVSNVNAQGLGKIGRYYIDALTGRVLTYVSDKHECGLVHCSLSEPTTAAPGQPVLETVAMPPIPTTVTVMAWTRTGNDGFAALSNVPLVGLVLSVPGIGNVTTDANGQFTIDIAAPVNITVGMLDGTHTLPVHGANQPAGVFAVNPGVNSTIQLLTSASTFNEAAHTTAFWWVQRTNDWCRSILGNTAQLNTADGIDTEVNIASTCNAYYTGNTINFYAAGGGCNNTAFSSVVSHEWGHGLDDRYGGITNVTGDGLSEGWGDILGCYLTDSPILGSGFQTAGVGIRNGNNTTTYPSTGAAVHTAGQVWMGFAWRLRERLATSLGNRNQAIAISEDIVISSIAADASDRVAAVREVFIADDDDGNLLNGVPHYNELSGAANDKLLPFPVRQVGTIGHTALANTTQQLTPRLVTAMVTPISGSFTQVRLHYNDGVARIRNMHGTGVTNQFQALLPGRLNGTTTTYHIEAVHSSSEVVRLPASGEFSYATGNTPTVFTDGFETGGPGWTHGMVATQDDWQVGDPFGRTGTGWADPTTAATGVNCYGNDIGNVIGTTTWNGAYQNNVNNWLRSPVINCSGRTGVRLRFKRWLTVQASTGDQASVWVNGAQVWVNGAVANLIDTSWQQMDIAIPTADNNPAVTLEWRLVTNAATVFGGWNIDDVEVVYAGTASPLDAQLTMLPEQSVQGGALTLNVVTQGGPKPFLVVIGDGAGPTSIPGLPTLSVGGAYVTLPDWTNAAGNYSVAFNAPTPVAAVGLFWYSQVLTLDAANAVIVASNPFVNLFTATP